MERIIPQLRRSVLTAVDGIPVAAPEHVIRDTTFGQDGESVARLVEYIFALPAEDRLEVLRRLAPPILAQLDDDTRGVFIESLNMEIARALIRSHTLARS